MVVRVARTESDAALAFRLDRESLGRLPQKRLAQLLLDAAAADPALCQRLASELASQPQADHAQADDVFMVGESTAMMQVFDRIRRYARSDAPVLVTGESGTGKELAAQAIHQRSARAAGPFVAINCAALPPSLIAAELFGHEKGAFTGAVARRIGHLERANGGTLFLDEIGDLPIELQGHLLRFLQDGMVQRVGGTEQIPVNLRIIAATNVPLREAIRQKLFRGDLFYRLDVLGLHMPPLRERGEDVPLLAHYFLQRCGGEMGREVQGFAPDALAALQRHAWPGNVREMIAVIRRAVVMGNGPLVTAEELALALPETAANDAVAVPTPAAVPAEGGEVAQLLTALRNARENVAHAARMLGVSRVTMYRKLRRHGIVLARDGLPDQLSREENGSKPHHSVSVT